jgi:hypothetical protein
MDTTEGDKQMAKELHKDFGKILTEMRDPILRAEKQRKAKVIKRHNNNIQKYGL